MQKNNKYQSIPTNLTEPEFNEFVLPRLAKGARGPNTKISFHRIFNYVLKLMHNGCQWHELAIERDSSGKPEIHYTRVFRIFQRCDLGGDNFSAPFRANWKAPHPLYSFLDISHGKVFGSLAEVETLH